MELLSKRCVTILLWYTLGCMLTMETNWKHVPVLCVEDSGIYMICDALHNLSMQYPHSDVGKIFLISVGDGVDSLLVEITELTSYWIK